jgi:hypothetical protein
MTGTPDDDVSEETRMLVARVRDRAAHTPGAPQIADMITGAAAEGRPMTAEEIRDLARDALATAERVTYLLGKLAGLLGDEDPP